MARLQQALQGATSWLDVRSRLEELAPGGDETSHRAFACAFGYVLIERSSEERRDSAGGPFGAMIATDRWSFPPRLTDVPPEDIEDWQTALEVLDDPIGVSRLADLLWEVKASSRPDLQARAAADAYLEIAADQSWPGIERTRCLTRALELARAVRDSERQAAATGAIRAFALTAIESDEGKPGIGLRLLSALVALPNPDRPTDLDVLLKRAGEVYGRDPHAADTVADLRARVVDPGEREALRRDQVALWRAAAEEGDGMLRVVRLEHALDVARTHGLSELAEDLRGELQAIGTETLDFEKFSAETETPAAEVDAFLASFTDGTWQDALLLLGSQGPPGGDPEEIEETIEQQMSDFPLQFLVTKAIVGPDRATTIFRATDHASHRRLAISEWRALGAQIWGGFAMKVLDTIRDHHGDPEHTALTEFFTTDLIDARTADRIAKALKLHWAGEPDESAHLLVPRIEAVLRELARRVGISIIREPVGAEPGGVRSLGTILRELREPLPDVGWHAYLENVLTDQLGVNLRNVIAHGLRVQATSLESSLLIHVACYLRLLGLQESEPAEQPQPEGNDSDT